MCGRFSFAPSEKIIEERFDIKVDKNIYKPRYNCAPSQDLAVISNTEQKKLSYYRWGLIPFWAKDKLIGNKLINAKAETISVKVSFKNSFKRKRCLVLSDSFYEWAKNKERTPYRIALKNNNLFTMAGIWDTWTDAQGKQINSFAIITTSANKLLKNIHHRMPVILLASDEKDWLNNNDIDKIEKLLIPYPSRLMQAYPISKLINSPLNDTPEVWTPLNL